MSKNLDLSKLDSFQRGNIKRMLKSIAATEDKITKVKSQLDIYTSKAESTLQNLTTNLEGYISLIDNILKPYKISYKDAEDEVTQQPIIHDNPEEADVNFNFTEEKSSPLDGMFKEIDNPNNINID